MNPSIPATNAAVSWTPEGCLIVKGTATKPLVKSPGPHRGPDSSSKKSVIHPLIKLLPVGNPEKQNKISKLFLFAYFCEYVLTRLDEVQSIPFLANTAGTSS